MVRCGMYSMVWDNVAWFDAVVGEVLSYCIVWCGVV